MFELISNIKTNKEKNFYRKINIYIKFTNIIAQSLKLENNYLNDQLAPKTVLELINLNIFKSKDNFENLYLNKILKKN